MNDYKIDSGIPMPKPKRKYPFEQLKVGDSFEVEGVSAAQLCVNAQHYTRKHGWKFTARTTGFNKCRVWRIS
jgi:hypothetical protein